MDICKIKISKNDNLPQLICKQCKKEVVRVQKFVSVCRRSEERLRNIFYNNSIESVSQIDKSNIKREYREIVLNKQSNPLKNEKYQEKVNDNNSESKRVESFDSITESESKGVSEKKVENVFIKVSPKNQNENCSENSVDKFEIFCENYHRSKKQIGTKKSSDSLKNDSIKQEIETDVEYRTLDISKSRENNYQYFDGLIKSNFIPQGVVEPFCRIQATETSTLLNVTSPYICKVCGVTLCSKGSLRVHQATHSSERPHKCDQCNLRFKLKSHLIGHQKNIHEGLKKHACKLCSKRFYGSAQLKIHIMAHTKNYPHLCTHCGKRFAQQCYLRVHQKMHMGIKDLKCKRCDYTSGNQSAMRMHIKGVHDIDKKHQCSQCGLRFMFPSGLQAHLTTHTGLKKYECSLCHKKFRTASSLKSHERIHSDEKPYQCNYCDKSFRILAHKKVHERIHTGEKPYICIICTRGFQTRGNLNTHQKIHNKA